MRIVYNMHYLRKLYMDKQTKMHESNPVEKQNTYKIMAMNHIIVSVL